MCCVVLSFKPRYFPPCKGLFFKQVHTTAGVTLLYLLAYAKQYCIRLGRGLTGGFLLLQNFSVAISVSPHVCFILVLILISMLLR